MHPFWPGEPIQRRANQQASISGILGLRRSSRTSVSLELLKREGVEKMPGKAGVSKALLITLVYIV